MTHEPNPPAGLAATVLTAMFCTLLTLSPMAYVAYRQAPPRIATVDLQKLVEEDQQRAITVLGQGPGGVASAEQRAAYLATATAFAKKLSDAVDALGQTCNCVIVNKAAVLGGKTVDYTDGLRQRMNAP